MPTLKWDEAKLSPLMCNAHLAGRRQCGQAEMSLFGRTGTVYGVIVCQCKWMEVCSLPCTGSLWFWRCLTGALGAWRGEKRASPLFIHQTVIERGGGGIVTKVYGVVWMGPGLGFSVMVGGWGGGCCSLQHNSATSCTMVILLESPDPLTKLRTPKPFLPCIVSSHAPFPLQAVIVWLPCAKDFKRNRDDQNSLCYPSFYINNCYCSWQLNLEGNKLARGWKGFRVNT